MARRYKFAPDPIEDHRKPRKMERFFRRLRCNYDIITCEGEARGISFDELALKSREVDDVGGFVGFTQKGVSKSIVGGGTDYDWREVDVYYSTVLSHGRNVSTLTFDELNGAIAEVADSFGLDYIDYDRQDVVQLNFE